MIKRIWNGYTTPENADAYERLLDSFVFPGIEAKKIPGYRSIELMRRDVGDEVQFTTVMSFDSIDNVIAFQGADYETAYVPEEARKVLKRWDARSSHHEVRQTRIYG
jgi:antibiotic biosynthesis monooxygenase (ABM) superfamily enzyme